VEYVLPSRQLTEGLAWVATALVGGMSIGTFFSGMTIDHLGWHGGFLVVFACCVAVVICAIAFLPVLHRQHGAVRD
jgi:predicted MFS family arabinose efflux permease